MKKPSKKRSQAALKAWKTRRRNLQAKEPVSSGTAAALKAWKARRKNAGK